MTPRHAECEVIENVRLARDTYRIRLRDPELAAAILPGQFVMLRLGNPNDPLLGRPFALYDTVVDEAGRPFAIDVVYLVVGKVTGELARLSPGMIVSVWGPLGQGFRVFDGIGHVALIAGGIGQTPFLAYARQLLGSRGYGQAPPRRMANRVSLFYGVRTREYVAGVEDFKAAGCTVSLASDDGSVGSRGLVTQFLLRPDAAEHWVACGPEPMMHAVATMADERGVPCDVSLETPMACGLGICFSCVTKVATPEGWDYRRVCVDGPVFDSRQIVWP